MYLGVILDNKMSWIQHVAYVKNKVAKGIGIMFKARTYLDRKCLINLYNANIYPYLFYCVDSWGNQSAMLIKCIFYPKNVRLIHFPNYKQDFHIPSKYIFRERQVLLSYTFVENRITLL